LGLTITKLIELQGGTITVSQMGGKGSEFSLLIHYPKDKSGIKDVTITENTTLTHDFLKNTKYY
jgi:hypothetical protein